MEDEAFAVSAESVSEVIDVPRYAPLPGLSGWLLGVSVYRSEPVPVIDLAAFVFNLARATVPAQTALVLHYGRHQMIFVVQRIDDLIALEAQVQPYGSHGKPSVERGYLDPYHDINGRAWRVLNLHRLCRLPEFLNPAAGSGPQ